MVANHDKLLIDLLDEKVQRLTRENEKLQKELRKLKRERSKEKSGL